MLEKIFGNWGGYTILPARLALGWIFIAHGGQKLFGLWGGSGFAGFGMYLEGMGLKPGLILAILAGGAEFFGGLMVLLGVYARLGALAIIAVMAVAVAKVHWPHGFFLMNQGYEYNVALLGLALVLLFGGSGKFSIKED